MNSYSYRVVLLCLLLAGCGQKVPPNGIADGVVLCNGFGGLKDLGYYEATVTRYKRKVTVEAKCKDGSSVWRTTEEKL